MTTSDRTKTPDPVTTSWLDELRAVPAIRPGRFAAISHMARSSVYDAIKSGTLPSIKIGRTTYLPTAPLLELFGVSGEGPEAAEREQPEPAA